eukprot:CAMPEP_0181230644 /NCGR_PEP_ID=MMETSP1096-20121128/34604_1 /TAXON_ID=156174 ORGANISM="Chrysochromulina ericina, Strain CCMP281" /NCGR_SAMPLE_ID=MMETSP1096 /ASSEMBLY_ACC=CAM_ASM_000453 /LENGTH=61 /DNA_ID=CAMNT_0023324475 /DNA_START=108 /DNA_END=290 /DNA_ORIENTATION=+
MLQQVGENDRMLRARAHNGLRRMIMRAPGTQCMAARTRYLHTVCSGWSISMHKATRLPVND